MKKIAIISLCLFSIIVNAQTDFSCGTLYENVSQPEYNRTASYDRNVKYTFNILFHYVYDDNGQNSTNQVYGEAEVMQALYYLNKNFNQFNIFFKYKGLKVTNSSEITNNPGWGDAIAETGSINLLFVNYANGASGVTAQGNTRLKLAFQTIGSPNFEFALCHEMGHAFNLYHTFHTGTGGYPCEHVTRDTGDITNYNADVAGDLVEDTPATNGSLSYTDCQYITSPSYVDCQGTPYENVIPSNFLSVESSGTTGCTPHFTLGQGLRMRAYVATLPLMWSTVITPITSLYISAF